jgi:hypothetical protein
MKIEKRLVLLITLSAIVTMMFLASMTGTARAVPSAQMKIAPSFAYYANYTTALPTTLTFNISVVNVTDMATWQLSIRWNNSLLTYGLISIPSDNVFSPQSLIVVAPDTSVPGTVVYGANIPPGGNSFNGSGVIAQLRLNVTTTVTPPVSCAVELADVPDGTFILDSSLVSMPITPVNAAYAYTYATGTQVTHSISGSSNPVVTQSNGTVAPDSAGIDTVNKRISFNVTGNAGDSAFLYAILPKNVINVTTLSHWNVTVNGVPQSSPQITENATHTFVFTTFPFASQVTLGVKGDSIIPELSSMLVVLIIASSATVAIVKSRTRRK